VSCGAAKPDRLFSQEKACRTKEKAYITKEKACRTKEKACINDAAAPYSNPAFALSYSPMATNCDRTSAAPEAALCPACLAAGRLNLPAAAATAPEYDHRGIRLPARSRVGGIITPQ
jgi:hypothetical protein